MIPEFKDAKLYSCSDSEFVTHTGWGDAIAEQLEGDWQEGETISEQCQRTGPVTVTAYNPGEISDSWLDAQVELLLERFREDFSEEYGCEDYSAEPWTDETIDWAKKVITSNLKKSLRSAQTYTVVTVGTHTFSVEECIGMLK